MLDWRFGLPGVKLDVLQDREMNIKKYTAAHFLRGLMNIATASVKNW